MTNAGSVGPFPIRIPMIDIETIGTGGGIDRVAQPRGPPQGRTAQRRRRARSGVLSERRHQRALHHHRRQSRARAHPAGADRRRNRARCQPGARARGSRRWRGGFRPGNMSAGGGRWPSASSRDRQLEPSQCDPADDHPARYRSPRLRAALVRRRRARAVSGGDGAARHEGLHRAARSGQPQRLRPARGGLAHRPYPHQGHARGRRRSRRHRGGLCGDGAGRDRDAPCRRHRAGAHAHDARSGPTLRRAIHGGAGASSGGRDRCGVSGESHRRLSCHAPAYFRLRLCRRAKGRARQFLRLRLRADRAAEPAEARESDSLKGCAEIAAPGIFRWRVPRYADL